MILYDAAKLRRCEIIDIEILEILDTLRRCGVAVNFMILLYFMILYVSSLSLPSGKGECSPGEHSPTASHPDRLDSNNAGYRLERLQVL